MARRIVPDDGRPGPWIVAAFRSDCAWGDEILEGDEIRADGQGGWEHQACAEEDDSEFYEDEDRVDPFGFL